MKRGHGFIWAKALVILCGVLLLVGCDRRTEASMPERLTEVILETPMSFATRFYPMDGMTCLDITAGENGYLLLAQENDVMQEIALDASFQVLSRQSAAPEAKALLREGKACFTYEGQAETGFSVRQNGEEKFTVQGEPNCQMAAVGQTLYLVTAGQLYVDGQQVSLPENWSATGLLKLKGQMLVALASHEGEVEISFLYPVSPNLREVAAPEEGTSDGWGGVNCVHRSDSAESRWGTASSNPSLNRWKAAASMVGWLHSLHAYIGVMRSAGVLLAVE